MTSHGWFLALATDKDELLRIAQAISEKDGVESVDLVTGPYNLMVRFNLTGRDYQDFRALLDFLLSQGLRKIDTWFGLEHFARE